MLIPAALVKDELAAAWKAALLADFDRFRWYRSGSGTRWLHEVDQHGDWADIERASVQVDDAGKVTVLGYCMASIDRDTMVCHALAAWSASPSLAYLRDLNEFCDQILGQVRYLRFNHAVGNPAGKGWAAWVERHDGYELCTMRAYARGTGGDLLDMVWYEVPGGLVEG